MSHPLRTCLYFALMLVTKLATKRLFKEFPLSRPLGTWLEKFAMVVTQVHSGGRRQGSGT